MPAPVPSPDTDTKPDIWIGHVSIAADDLERSYDFYLGLGLRSVFRSDSIGVLELAGGTHIVLVPRDGDDAFGLTASVDLMVDDVDAARDAWREHEPTEIVKGGVHRTFRLHDPAGNEIAVHDSHVIGVV